MAQVKGFDTSKETQNIKELERFVRYHLPATLCNMTSLDSHPLCDISRAIKNTIAAYTLHITQGTNFSEEMFKNILLKNIESEQNHIDQIIKNYKMPGIKLELDPYIELVHDIYTNALHLHVGTQNETIVNVSYYDNNVLKQKVTFATRQGRNTVIMLPTTSPTDFCSTSRPKLVVEIAEDTEDDNDGMSSVYVFEGKQNRDSSSISKFTCVQIDNAAGEIYYSEKPTEYQQQVLDQLSKVLN